MIFTDDYQDEYPKIFHFPEDKDETQDKEIEKLIKAVEDIKDEVEELQTKLDGLDGKIDDKYAAQTRALSAKVNEAVNTLQNNLANKTTSAQVVTDNLQATTAVINELKATKTETDDLDTVALDAVNTKTSTLEVTNTLRANVENIQTSTIYYLNAVNAVINNLNMDSLNVRYFESNISYITELTTSIANITRLNTGLITVSDGDTWHVPTSQPVNDELLKVSIPEYDGIVNIVSDGINITLLNNTLITFDQETNRLFRVEFDADETNLDGTEKVTNLYFTQLANYKEIHIGADSYKESFSSIVDKTLYEQNINAKYGTVSATEITYGDNISISVDVVDVLPDTGSKNTIYVVRNDKSYYWKDDDYVPMSLDIDIVSGHTTKGSINENLIYPATQYTSDYSKTAFSGTFYEVTDFMISDQIPEGAKLIYLENDTLKFCNTLPPYSGTMYGSPTSVQANKDWFDSIIWLKEPVRDRVLLTSGDLQLEYKGQAGSVFPYGTVAFSNDLRWDIRKSPLDNPFCFYLEYDFRGEHYSSSINVLGGGTHTNLIPDWFLGYQIDFCLYQSANRETLETDWVIRLSTTEQRDEYPPVTNLKVYRYPKSGDAEQVVDLDDFEYRTPAITISDEAGHSASIGTQKVQSYIDYRQNAINNLLDLRSSENKAAITDNTTAIATNTTNIATNTANIATNTAGIAAINNAKGQPNGFASLDNTGRLPPEQLPTSALMVVGYLDAANVHVLPDASGYDPGSEIIIISDGYYNASTAFTLVKGRTLTDVEVIQANTLIANGYVFTLYSGSTTLGTVKTFNKTSVVLSNDSVISLPYTTDLSATSVPGTVQIPVLAGDVVIQIDGHWIHMENKNAVTSVNGNTGAVTITYSNIGAQAELVSGTNIKTLHNKSLLGSGNINLTASDVGALPSTYVAPVTSVNGNTGAVKITLADLGIAIV